MEFKKGKVVVSQEVAKVLDGRLDSVKKGESEKFDIVRTAYYNNYLFENNVINSNNFKFESLMHALQYGYVVEEPKYKKEDLQFRMLVNDKYDNELTIINQVGYDLYSVTMVENGFVYTVMIEEKELLDNLNDGSWILQ